MIRLYTLYGKIRLPVDAIANTMEVASKRGDGTLIGGCVVPSGSVCTGTAGASSSVDKGGVFLVRGAEGSYAQWLTGTGGCYDGFLLSTANCFSQNLFSLIGSLEKNDQEKAREISEKLTIVVSEVFALVQPLPYGNPFTNANKAIDHFFAFGPSANTIEEPMLHEKIRIPHDLIQATGAILTHHSLMPEKGYME